MVAVTREREPWFADLRDRFCDPRGWLLDSLPWKLRRVWVAWRYREWPPDSVRLCGWRRPSRRLIDAFRSDYEADGQALGANTCPVHGARWSGFCEFCVKLSEAANSQASADE